MTCVTTDCDWADGPPFPRKQGAHPGWFCLDGGFCFHVTVCPPRRARISKSGRRTRGIRDYGPWRLQNYPTQAQEAWSLP